MNLLVFLFLVLDTTLLFFETSRLCISYEEVEALQHSNSFIYIFVNFFLEYFGHNDFILRLPMILLHELSAVLVYLISKEYLKYEKDRVWLVVIFLLLPGVISSALVVNSAGFIIFGLLFFIFSFQKFKEKAVFILSPFYFVADPNFIYLFLALSFYSFFKKNYYLFFYSFSFLVAGVLVYGLNIKGVPSGHFLDVLALYGAVFTPFVFIYIFYVLYRRYLLKKLDLVWFIAVTSLIYSLLLSFRQSLGVENIAPYLIMALFLAAQNFENVYRLRVKEFRLKYKIAFFFAFSFLVFNSVVLLLNKELYPFLDKPKNNFIYNFDIAKELAKNLKARNINCITTEKKMMQRLKFYNIAECQEYKLTPIKNTKEFNKKDYVTVRYKDVVLYRGYVTKLNNIKSTK